MQIKWGWNILQLLKHNEVMFLVSQLETCWMFSTEFEFKILDVSGYCYYGFLVFYVTVT